ncbi:hypothetical protein ACZ75_03720 [Massilia sp. NR 4-1]|nr:non-ribosomal peptide synthetase [Massilia sp. NR 4-1]AKU20749.1 hypothetical protein ACZ75_03720 [Massilia sp. NR 4-1]
MTMENLLEQLDERGIVLALDGAELVVRGKKQGLDAALLAQLRQHKQALIGFLAAGGGSDGAAAAARDGIPAGSTAITPDMLPLVQLEQAQIDALVARVPGGAANVQDIYPLAPLHEGILFHHLLDGEGDPYLMSQLTSFDSRERADGYLRALQSVLDRHDMLRTAIQWENLPAPVQVVWRRAPLPLTELELDPGAGDIAQQLMARFDSRHYRLDLRQAPMMQGVLAHDPVQGRWLLLTLYHHLVGDRVALELLDRELEAHLLGAGGALPPAQPFRHFIAHLQRAGKGGQEADEAFFRRMLGDVDEATLPFGLQPGGCEGGALGEARLHVDAALAARLRQCGRKLGVGPASLFHLAWAQVLARLSGRKDVVFATILSGRMTGGALTEGMLGMFMNTLPLRVRLDGGALEAAVRQVQADLVELMQHEQASLTLAQRCSAVPAPAPLFSAMLNYRHSVSAGAVRSSAAQHAWQGIVRLASTERNNYPLTLSVDDLGEGFHLTVLAQAPASAQRVGRFMERALEQLAQALETAPHGALAELDVLPPEERAQLEAWNASAAAYPLERGVHRLFEDQVARTPDATAVVYLDQTLSYTQLNARANRLARHLRTLGVGPNVLAGICVERSLEMVVGILAILKAGGAYVPLDPAYPAERLGHMLRDAQLPVLLTQQGVLARLPQLAQKDSQVLCLDREDGWLDACDSANLEGGSGADDLAYAIYTSGSTGRPKGTLIHQRGLCNLVNWYIAQFGLGGQDRALLFSSFSFDLTQKNLFAPLLVGGQLHIPLEGYAPDQAPAYIARHGITFINCAPSAFYPLLDYGLREQGGTLRHVFLGGEPINAALLHGALGGMALRVHNTYGPTEASDVVAYYSWNPAEALDSLPIGRPVANVRLYVLDGAGRLAPAGVAGEICVGGLGVGRGYLGRPEQTAERFGSDPYAPAEGGRLYRTGDIGRWRDDGQLEFIGRRDFQVKLRGFRIELGEIEARMTEHPAVREALAMVRQDGAAEQLVAYATLFDSSQIEGLPELQAEQVAAWRDAYDNTYSHSHTDNAVMDYAGWVSSYTGAPIPLEEMQEWRENTVQRIQALRPRRVLEIGCGSGLLLLQLAPQCEEYVGTDISPETLQRLGDKLGEHGLSQVSLHERGADNFDGFQVGQFDTIVINSVIQHFPGADYLMKVIHGALRLLSPQGRLFLGDLRNLNLFGAFHASTQLFRSADGDSAADVRARVVKAMEMDTELLLAPDFFLALKTVDDAIGSLQILPKAARYRNELTDYRYDVVLHRATLAPPSAPLQLDWEADRLSAHDLAQRLAQHAAPLVLIRNIGNERVVWDAQLYQSLSAGQGAGESSAAALSRQLRDPLHALHCLDPERLAQIAVQAGYQLELSWTGCDAEGRYGAILRRHGDAGNTQAFPHEYLAQGPLPAQPRRHANDPLQYFIRARVGETLKQALQAALPEYMVPAHIVFLDQLPLTAHGKVDRAALPAPGLSRQDTDYIAPRSALERLLADTWAKLLKVERVGLHDDFFDLGGHSLLAVQTANVLKQAGVLMPVADLFKYRTVELLARQLAAQAGASADRQALAIRAGGRQKPLFLVHDGSGSLLYATALAQHIDSEIPLYGLPPEPLGEVRLNTIEGMAKRLVGLMRAVQPNGPYRVAGYCAGGTVAYEIASQLLGDNEAVEFVGMLNTAYIPPGAYMQYLMPPKARLLAQAAPVAEADPALQAAFADLRQTAQDMSLQQLIEACQQQGMLPPTLAGMAVQEIEQVLERLQALAIAADGGSYVCHPLPVPVHYFGAAENPADAPARGWDAALAAGQCRLTVVPGNHQSMLQPPHLATLAARMAQQLCAAAESPVTERAYSPLVALQTGTPAHTPVFCIPGAGANVGSFVALAAALGKETPVYGLQPRGLDGVAVPYASVETAARDYVKAIRQLYPDGRVNLLGHSFGGWVACEIARQLHAAGCGRPALVLVDSLPPGGAAVAAEYTHAMVLRDMAAVLQEAAAQPLELALDELQQASEAEQYALLHRAMVAAGLMPERSLPNALRGPLRSFARCLRTAYTPEGQYPGPLLLVQAAGSAAAAGEEARRAQEQAWRNYAPRLQAWCAPGNHMTVLGEAHAAALAARLRAEWEVAAKTALAAQ